MAFRRKGRSGARCVNLTEPSELIYRRTGFLGLGPMLGLDESLSGVLDLTKACMVCRRLLVLTMSGDLQHGSQPVSFLRHDAPIPSGTGAANDEIASASAWRSVRA